MGPLDLLDMGEERRGRDLSGEAGGRREEDLVDGVGPLRSVLPAAPEAAPFPVGSPYQSARRAISSAVGTGFWPPVLRPGRPISTSRFAT